MNQRNMLKDLFFPKFCVNCGFLGCYICLSCQKKLVVYDGDRCLYCGRLSFFGLTHPSCRKEKGVDGVVSVFIYNLPIKKIIQNIKYRLSTEVLKELLNLVPINFLYKISFYRNFSEEWFLQSIPLHHERLKKRGFNQSNMIRDFLKTYIPGGDTIEILERLKNTAPQAQIKKKGEKYFNVKGAFGTVNMDKADNKNIILIDDVITTGNTIKEACRILKKGGVRRVFAITIAKG